MARGPRALVPPWGGPRPAPYASYVRNTRQSSRDRACSSSRERALVQGSALSRLVPMLGQGRAAGSPVYLICSTLAAFPGTCVWHQVGGEKPPGPSSGSGKEKPFLSWAGCQLLLGPAEAWPDSRWG